VISEVVNSLFETLNCKGVVYCHWKSNFSLPQAISGEMDLDLLVDRNSLPQVVAILTELGYKSAIVKWEPATPSISHYYGLDPQTGQLVHVHLFGNILTGESFVKGYLFPFEQMLFEDGYYLDQIKLPSKPAELVLFVLRTFIKYGSLLDLIYLLRKPESVREELHWLQADSDTSEALSLLEKYCPAIDEQLFMRCIDTLNGDNSLFKRVILAQHVRRRLHIYEKHTSLQRGLAYAQLLWGQLQRRLNRNAKNKMLSAGGAVVAFVGPEATGKSTLVSECERWLGDVFAVRAVHAGKPPSSWLTIPVNGFIPLARRLLPKLRTTRLEGHGSAVNATQSHPNIEGLPSLIHALRAVILAWDRWQLLRKVRRLAANGEIVICDRYPSEAVGAMDSRRLQENPTKDGVIVTIYNWLARLEDRLYQQIPPPDIVLRLKVSVEIAKKRNRERIKPGKESDAYLESRHRQSQDWHMSGTKYVYEINTQQPLVETILCVKKAIWKSL
jgi:thymidylate kinase